MRWRAAAKCDGMFIGEPEDGLIALAQQTSLDQLDAIPSLTFRRQGRSCRTRAQGTFTGFQTAPVPGRGICSISRLQPAAGQSARTSLVETSRGCSHTVRTSASRRSIRPTSSSEVAESAGQTKWSAATASSA